MYAFNAIVLALAATVFAAPNAPTNSINGNKVTTAAHVAAACGDTKAYCCNNAQPNVGAVVPIELANCESIPILAIPLQKACTGQVCCQGVQNSLLNIQCFQDLL